MGRRKDVIELEISLRKDKLTSTTFGLQLLSSTMSRILTAVPSAIARLSIRPLPSFFTASRLYASG